MDRNARISCTIERITINTPTAVIRPRAGTRLTTHPPNGAASTPPNTNGMRCSSDELPSSVKNVVVAATVTKNSAVLTEPTAWRGACPEPTSVEVVIGPQPPPPLASRNPATNPSGGGGWGPMTTSTLVGSGHAPRH